MTSISGNVGARIFTSDAALDLTVADTSQSGAVISTAEAMLDLSGITVTAVNVESTNATGTTFGVSTAATGVQIKGGAGVDTQRTADFAFAATERDFIFNSGSVEIIQDSSGINGDVTANTLTALAAGADDGLGNTAFVMTDGTTFSLLGVNYASLDQDDSHI